MSPPTKILVIQTAFPGDVVLTLPMVQRLKREIPGASIDFLVVPAAAGLLRGHPDIREIIVFDKRGDDSGIAGLFRISGRLRRSRYDCAIVPHRSLRSAVLSRLAGIPIRIGFHTSAGSLLWTSRVKYDAGVHEILRNLALTAPLGVAATGLEAPRLHPSPEDIRSVDELLGGKQWPGTRPLVAMSPGSVWNTKRWPEEKYTVLAGELVRAGHDVVLIGGPRDAPLCARIAAGAGGEGVLDSSGRLSFLGSAELLRRAVVLVCNDSAPMHIAGAMGTRVVTIFGATVPRFGFGPIGPEDVVIETTGLPCRPCSIHGGDVCPIGTFECMNAIEPQRVLASIVDGKR